LNNRDLTILPRDCLMTASLIDLKGDGVEEGAVESEDGCLDDCVRG